MKVKKARKPRGFKLNGHRSDDMCTCFSFGCDPMAMSHKFTAKINKRLRAGLCGACGSNPCKCKSSLTIKREK
jgi:hypothetical protein